MDLRMMQKEFESMTKGGDSFIPNEGETTIRILPPWNKLSNMPFKKTGYHEVLGERFVCPRETTKEACPICERVRQLYKSKSEEDKALAKELRSIQRFYFNIVVRGQESKGVQKFGCGQKLTEKIVNIMTKELSKDITDPDTGNDIIIVKKKIGDYPDYSSTYVMHQESPLGNKDLLNQLHDLDREFGTKTYDELRDIIERRLGPSAGSNTAYTPRELAKPEPLKAEPLKPTSEEVKAEPLKPAAEEVKAEPVKVATDEVKAVPAKVEEKVADPNVSAEEILNQLNL